MGREYKHSVKGSLTRKLILIIVISVFIIYGCIVTVQTFAAKFQSADTTIALKKLQPRVIKILCFANAEILLAIAN